MSNFYYTSEQDEIIKSNWETKTDAQLGKMIGKTRHGIKGRRTALGLTKRKQINWTDSEEKYLRDNYLNKTDSELAKELNRTSVDAVKAKRMQLGLKVGRNSKKSSCKHRIAIPDKERFLQKYGKTKIEIALQKDTKRAMKLLKCSKSTITRINRAFGVVKRDTVTYDEKVDFIIKNYKRTEKGGKKTSNRWIAKKLNLTPEQVSGIAQTNKHKIIAYNQQKEREEGRENERMLSAENVCPLHHCYTVAGICFNCEVENIKCQLT